MRVWLSTYGSRGDVEPLVVLAVRLRALGAEVRVCAPLDPDVISHQLASDRTLEHSAEQANRCNYGNAAMELAGLEPATSWVRSRRSPS